MEPDPHDYDCFCERCRLMAAAICATDEEDYLFTDEELLRLSEDLANKENS